MQRAATWTLVTFGMAVLLLGATLAMPVKIWRTGRLPVPPFQLLEQPAPDPTPRRIWIDTDAACGAGPQVDVDDCLAIWALARASTVEIVGVSTVFGNRPLDETDRTTRELVEMLGRAGHSLPVVRRGADRPATAEAARSAAIDGLVEVLDVAPATIVALGPLTNIAAALERHPALASRVTEIVAVMGRRPGHLFHPSEGNGRGAFLGHGPVFRDFNFCADPTAAARVLQTNVKVTLIPYDAAVDEEVTTAHLARLSEEDVAGAWIAEHSRDWLTYWTEAVGRRGFSPFDLEASRFVIAPNEFRCAEAAVRLARDPLFHWPFNRQPALLAEPPSEATDSAQRLVRYCPERSRGSLERALAATGGMS